MPETIVRNCTACKESIEISRSDLTNVIYYDKAYYHKACFCERAEKRSQSKCKKQKEWQSALNNISELEIDTKRMLKSSLDQGDLNEWLLRHYDISVVPKRFWQIVADLERGAYKGKRCKPVTMETLLGAWKWGQKKLDSIANNNKMKHTGPQNDEARITYDLAVLVQKVPLYLTQKETGAYNEARIQETKEKAVRANMFNYEELSKQAVSSTQEESNDILDLMNEIF
jgi:hypothetical protein